MSELQNPIERFTQSMARATSTFAEVGWGAYDSTAAAFATTDEHGQPSVRYVLVKEFDEAGFYIYTNYESKKGHDLALNPRGALCFYWPWLGEQVRIDGTVSRLRPERSDAYFQSRPRGSQIGAWASRQSRPLSSRSSLEADIDALTRQFGDGPIARPPHWGGYALKPERIEFWNEGEYRLHDRELYVREGAGWRSMTLYP